MPTQKELAKMFGHDLIRVERFRQVDVEGWTPDHDFRNNVPSDLAQAAIAYIANAVGRDVYIRSDSVHEGRVVGQSFDDPWPKRWNKSFDKRKKHGRQRSAEIGGGLCAALIDLLIAREGDQPADDDVRHKNIVR
jgi:hypothetical protein